MRRGKEVEIPVKEAPTLSMQEKEKNVVVERNIPNDDEVPKLKFLPLSNYKPVHLFPQALAKSREDEKIKLFF